MAVNIGLFERDDEDGFIGPIETLGLKLNPVRFVPQDKGADYAVHGPMGEFGAAWRRSGEWGPWLSVRLECPTLPSPITASMKLTPREDGFFVLRWQRRENGRTERSNSKPEKSE